MNRSMEALLGLKVQFTEAYLGSRDTGHVGVLEKVAHMVWRVKGLKASENFTTSQIAEIRIRAGEMPEIFVEK